jgi:thymidylate synthase ThyX
MSDFFINDELHPEDNAMLQALYSRSPESVINHLDKVKRVGSGKFMDQYYVGYGHQSIGDCGSTTLFIEYVSMLAAKAIQDSPLYNGQEASTRYIDMSKQPVLNPLGTPEGKSIQDRWMAFYNAAQAPTVEHLKAIYPLREGEDPKQYEKAIKARSFDVLRSFLPAGCTTLVSWHTTLRHAADHLEHLRHYPLMEVRSIAESLDAILFQHYPHSFAQKRYEAKEAYLKSLGAVHLYDGSDCPAQMRLRSTISEQWGAISYNDENLLLNRPPKVRLPHRFDALGQITYEFPLDFGSFRDLQRHRNGVCRMPLLSTQWGFHQWYLDQLPADLRQAAVDLIAELSLAISSLPGSAAEKQPYVAMGFNVPCSVTRGLPGTLYLIELRTSKTVHPTMRKAAQEMYSLLHARYPGLPIHADMSPDDWDIRRGAQDIVAR